MAQIRAHKNGRVLLSQLASDESQAPASSKIGRKSKLTGDDTALKLQSDPVTDEMLQRYA